MDALAGVALVLCDRRVEAERRACAELVSAAGCICHELSTADVNCCGTFTGAFCARPQRPGQVKVVAADSEGKGAIHAVECWFCGARGPFASSEAEALRRWAHLAERSGVPDW